MAGDHSKNCRSGCVQRFPLRWPPEQRTSEVGYQSMEGCLRLTTLWLLRLLFAYCVSLPRVKGAQPKRMAAAQG